MYQSDISDELREILGVEYSDLFYSDLLPLEFYF